jgi:hypothetical protein
MFAVLCRNRGQVARGSRVEMLKEETRKCMIRRFAIVEITHGDWWLCTMILLGGKVDCEILLKSFELSPCASLFLAAFYLIMIHFWCAWPPRAYNSARAFITCRAALSSRSHSSSKPPWLLSSTLSEHASMVRPLIDGLTAVTHAFCSYGAGIHINLPCYGGPFPIRPRTI